MKTLTEIGLNLIALFKYLGEFFLIVSVFSLILVHPILPWMLACQYQNGWWMLLYIPIAIIWGACLRKEE